MNKDKTIKNLLFLIVLKLLLDSANIYIRIKFGVQIPGILYSILNGIYLSIFVSFLFIRLKRKTYLNFNNILPLLFGMYLIVNSYLTGHNFTILNTYIVYMIAIFLFLTSKKSALIVKEAIGYLYFLFVFSLFFYVLSIDNFSLSFREVRVNSFYGNANEDAGVLLTLVPICLFRFVKANKNIFYQFLFVFIMMFLMVFFNGSRYAIGGLIITISIFYYLKYKKNRITKSLTLSVLTISIVLSLPFINNVLFKAIEKIDINKLLEQEGIDDDNLAGRIGGIWIPAITETYNKNFFLGFGAGSWDKQEVSIIEYNGKIINTNRAAHNVFVFNFYQFGIIGVCLFISFYIFGIRKSYLAIKIAPTLLSRDRSIALFCCWIGFLFWCSFANAWPRMGIPFLIILYSSSINNYLVLMNITKQIAYANETINNCSRIQ